MTNENPFSRYCGCGIPGDCQCHEDCGPREGCAFHMWEWQATRDEDHAEALAMLAAAPALIPGWGMVPGDSAYGATVRPAPWWWNRPESWEHQQLAAGLPVRGY
jgi:hypothetical protein